MKRIVFFLLALLGGISHADHIKTISFDLSQEDGIEGPKLVAHVVVSEALSGQGIVIDTSAINRGKLPFDFNKQLAFLDGASFEEVQERLTKMQTLYTISNLAVGQCTLKQAAQSLARELEQINVAIKNRACSDEILFQLECIERDTLVCKQQGVKGVDNFLFKVRTTMVDLLSRPCPQRGAEDLRGKYYRTQELLNVLIPLYDESSERVERGKDPTGTHAARLATISPFLQENFESFLSVANAYYFDNKMRGQEGREIVSAAFHVMNALDVLDRRKDLKAWRGSYLTWVGDVYQHMVSPLIALFPPEEQKKLSHELRFSLRDFSFGKALYSDPFGKIALGKAISAAFGALQKLDALNQAGAKDQRTEICRDLTHLAQCVELEILALQGLRKLKDVSYEDEKHYNAYWRAFIESTPTLSSRL